MQLNKLCVLQPGLARRRLAVLHAGMRVSCGLVGVPTTLRAVADVDADPSAVPITPDRLHGPTLPCMAL